MSLYIYAFRDKKSDVLSNHFISGEPWDKVKQNISVSLLNLSVKEPTNPFILFCADYELVLCGLCPETLVHTPDDDFHFVECSILLDASRKAFNSTKNQTSPTEVDENSLE